MERCNKPIKNQPGFLCQRMPEHIGKCALDVMQKYSPETATIHGHYVKHTNPKVKGHNAYKNQVWCALWDPRQGGTLEAARQWFRAYLPKPGPGYELHVLKTTQYPHGYFGPGGLKWVHKMDRHDKDLTALVSHWTDAQWEEFVKQENGRRLMTRAQF